MGKACFIDYNQEVSSDPGCQYSGEDSLWCLGGGIEEEIATLMWLSEFHHTTLPECDLAQHYLSTICIEIFTSSTV